MSGRVFLLGVSVVVLTLAFNVTEQMLGPRPGVTQANVRRIRRGMAEEQVQAIFGCDPCWGFGASGRCPWYVKRWCGEAGRASVFFHGRLGTVTDTDFVATRAMSPLERLRSWLGW